MMLKEKVMLMLTPDVDGEADVDVCCRRFDKRSQARSQERWVGLLRPHLCYL